MQRRWYLATLSTIVGGSLAGCTGEYRVRRPDRNTDVDSDTYGDANCNTDGNADRDTRTDACSSRLGGSATEDAVRGDVGSANKEGVTLTATTNVEPGTKFFASLDGKESPDRSSKPIFVRSRTEVSEEGRLVWEFDFSNYEGGREFEFTVDNSAQTWEYDGIVVADE